MYLSLSLLLPICSQVVRCVTKPVENQWFAIELPANTRFVCTHYTLRHYLSWVCIPAFSIYVSSLESLSLFYQSIDIFLYFLFLILLPSVLFPSSSSFALTPYPRLDTLTHPSYLPSSSTPIRPHPLPQTLHPSLFWYTHPSPSRTRRRCAPGCFRAPTRPAPTRARQRGKR